MTKLTRARRAKLEFLTREVRREKSKVLRLLKSQEIHQSERRAESWNVFQGFSSHTTEKKTSVLHFKASHFCFAHALLHHVSNFSLFRKLKKNIWWKIFTIAFRCITENVEFQRRAIYFFFVLKQPDVLTWRYRKFSFIGEVSHRQKRQNIYNACGRKGKLLWARKSWVTMSIASQSCYA